MDPTREQLERWDREHVWHPFTPMGQYAEEPPLIIERAHGCFLVDLDGREYLDGVSSLWCNVHGHRVPQLDAAIRDQLDAVAHSTLLGIANVPAIKLARRLVELAPPGLSHVFYSDNGATAVEVALKMAFQYWRQGSRPRPNKTKYLALNLAYHGDTLGDVSVGDLGRFHHLFAPLLFPILRAPSPYCYHCPLGLERANCKVDCVDVLAGLVRDNADSLAAVVIEPLVQAAAGMINGARGLPAPGARRDTRTGRLADRRRGRGRLRPHGDALCLRAGRRRARFPVPGEGADGRLPAVGGDADHG
jgi:adenosylmethionine-8-amino-7-oxononanoate aminotransferase